MLEKIFAELNAQHFQGELPPLPLRWNSRLRSSAGRFVPGSRNPLFPRLSEIEIATYLRDLPDGEFHIRDTLLHELVHYFLWQKKRPYGHTAEFKAILKRVGARRYNPVPRLTPVKYIYRCPHCATTIPARRKIRASACASCCKKFNGGYYADKFRLQLDKDAKSAVPQMLNPLAPEEIVRRLEDLKRKIKNFTT